MGCKREQYCTGNSAICPPSYPQDNDSPCLDKGKCYNGSCIPFCETIGLQSCMCDIKPDDYCKRCCKQRDGNCYPINPVEILTDGTACFLGFCERGRCEKAVQDVVQRFWDIIEEIDINTVGM